MALGGQSLTLNIIADDRVLKRVLADSKRNVSTFSKDVERTGAAKAGLLGGATGEGRQGKPGPPWSRLRDGPGERGPVRLRRVHRYGYFRSSHQEVCGRCLQPERADHQISSRSLVSPPRRLATGRSPPPMSIVHLPASGSRGCRARSATCSSAQGFEDLQNSKLSQGFGEPRGRSCLVQLTSTLTRSSRISSPGIVGEIEPVRKYGADLRVARVQQEALAESRQERRQSPDPAGAHARPASIFSTRTRLPPRVTVKRTAGGLANQQRILSAQVQETSRPISGTLLTPAVTEVGEGAQYPC